MKPDRETENCIIKQMVTALADHCDHAERQENGTVFVVQDGYWFKLSIETIDNGESGE